MWEMRGAGTQSFMGSGRSWAGSARSGSRRTAGGHFSGAAFGRLPVYQNQFGWDEDRPDVLQGRGGFRKPPVQGQAARDSSQPGRRRGGPAGHSSRRHGPGTERRVWAGGPAREDSSRPSRTPRPMGPGAESRLCHLVVECRTLETLLTS